MSFRLSLREFILRVESRVSDFESSKVAYVSLYIFIENQVRLFIDLYYYSTEKLLL